MVVARHGLYVDVPVLLFFVAIIVCLLFIFRGPWGMWGAITAVVNRPGKSWTDD